MMTNPDWRERVARAVDSPLRAEERRELERLLAESPAARRLHEELTALKAACAESVPPPPPGMGYRLQGRVDATYDRRRVRRWWRPAALVFAAAVFAALGLVWLAPGVERVRDPELAHIRAEIQKTHRDFQTAIARMERLAEKHLQDLPTATAAQYRASLAVIDEAIFSCEALVTEQPGNGYVYSRLARAYRAKVNLLETIIES